MFSRITAQLPMDGLLFWKLSGTETLSHSFVLTADLLATDARIDRHALLGQPVTFTLPTQSLLCWKRMAPSPSARTTSSW